ncbi:hypothetical protein [Ahrensia sp. 13_GOM-1096m]|uniref:hypothetical protein n=1 Tax=Ahrensia sp. 13_GOM-1096m TaxID=1380380 RepID=UPI00047DBACA|nr:hypothetical protein [Ahrensia sp. 13_GOM-1096m]
MLKQAHLEEAVRRGVINARQQADILVIAREGDDDSAAELQDVQNIDNDEELRLVGGGNDLFVTVGILMLFSGVGFALQTWLGDNQIIRAALMAVLMWLVAEFVTRQFRMKLSSTVLGLGFLGYTAAILGIYIWETLDLAKIADNPQLAFGLRPTIGSYGSAFFGGIALISILYFWRFRVPIMSAAIAVSLTGFAFLWTILYFYDGVTDGRVELPTFEQIPLILERALMMPLICGIIVFCTAVYFDLRDRERSTVWSDCAFWLHVISAPLLVHPLFILATGQDVVLGKIEPGMTASIMLGLLISAFVYVALAIDRRSLLIPTLAYFGSLGVYYMIESTANSTGLPPLALILLVIGLLVIMFGAGWQRIRALIVRPTLPTSLINKLPPIRV